MGFLTKNKSIIGYGLALAALLFVMRWLEFRLLVIEHAFEVYAGAIAVIFTSLGVWLALELVAPKTIIIEKEIVRPAEFTFNEAECARRNISKRELEVLSLMAEGLSNAEIAGRLFVSQNTVKSHAAKIFEKLEAKRRTQAIETAKKFRILA